MGYNILNRHEIKPEEMMMQRVGEKMMDLGCKLDDHVKDGSGYTRRCF